MDAVTDAHLRAIGEAAAGHPVITGGSGVAIGLPANFRASGQLPARDNAAALPHIGGRSAVLAGSCSRATLAQIGAARAHMAVLELDPLTTPDGDALVAQAQVATDTATHGRLLAEAEQALAAANVFIPFGQPIRWAQVRSNITGFAPNAWGFHPLPPLAQIIR